MNTDQLLEWMEIAKTYIVEYGLKAIGGIIFLIIGFWIAKIITKKIKSLMSKKDIDPALQSFIGSLTSIGLKLLVVISAMTMVGIAMTSFIAILGAAGLAVGLALQGTLQNFAGGTLILILKPYRIGDYVEMLGHDGIVAEIQIFNTILTSLDNKTIIIPNGSISNSSLTNFTRQETRRVDFTFGVAYGSDYKEVKDIIQSVLDSDDRILKDPSTFIGLGEMADSSINITTRAWTKTSDYWNVYFNVNEKIYATFTEKGISIPFPQMDVHIDNN